MNRIKNKLLVICAVSLFIAGCGSSTGTGTSPISIPAPTGGYLTASAPNPDGKSLVYGYIIVSDTRIPNVEVAVRNPTSSDSATATTNDEAFFSTLVSASLGDTIYVKYKDSDTDRWSEEATVTVDNETQPMSSAGMVPYDIALGSGGLAYVVGNDGTDSEIAELDLVNKTVSNRAIFTNTTFDKVASHSGIDHIAVLDTAGDMLYWFDTETLEDDVSAVSEFGITDPTDVAIADLSPDATIDDVVMVSVQSTTVSLRFYTIDPDNDTLSSTGTFCFAHPDDAAGDSIVACSPGYTVQPTQTTTVSAIVTTTDAARVSLITEYGDGSTAYHWGLLTSTAPPAITVATDAGSLARSFSIEFETDDDPNKIEWYNQTNALVTDSTNGNLMFLEEECPAACNIDRMETTAGTQPVGIVSDSDNNRAFVADEAGDNILGVDLTGGTVALSGDNLTAQVGPTEMVYYESDGSGVLGVVLPASTVMKIIDASP